LEVQNKRHVWKETTKHRPGGWPVEPLVTTGHAFGLCGLQLLRRGLRISATASSAESVLDEVDNYVHIVHTVIIEDIQELFQIEDAFWGCGQTLFK